MDNQNTLFHETCLKIEKSLKIGENMDAKCGMLIIAGKICRYYYLEGFMNKQALERIVHGINKNKIIDWSKIPTSHDFVSRHMFFSECVKVNFEDAINRVLSGFLLLIFEGYENELLIAEARVTPQRGIQEPTKGKTLRGPHEGFCENIVTNLALLRRRIKTTKLTVKEFTLGELTQTRLSVCYIDSVADKRNIDDVTNSINQVRIKAASMGEETLIENLFYKKKRSFLNPLPRARFTERPDTCAAELLEGKIVILIDTTPNAIILPMTLFEFFEECDNYYFPPVTASYLRIVRFFSFLSGIYLLPVWLLVLTQADYLPETLSFLTIHDSYSVPIFLQFLFIEIAIDALKLASLNTPDPLANSLSVVGGLLLGDFAVKSGWFVPQTILYSAIVTILNFIPNNYELGYAFKFWRISLLLLVQTMDFYGLIIGTIYIFISLFKMRDAAGRCYLYPFIPFDKQGIIKIFVRTISGKESK